MSYCELQGKDYVCDQPLPRTAFNTSGPLCAAVAQYQYDPANCDPGYWCGCSSSMPEDCLPDGGNWGGHFTTTYTNGTEVIFTGVFLEEEVDLCPELYYCPGKSATERCVDMCQIGFFCPNASVQLECTDGGYCPVASVTPRSCEGMESCKSEGLRRFEVGPIVGLMFLILFVAIGYLYGGNHMVVKRARRNRESKMSDKSQNGSSSAVTKSGNDSKEAEEGEEQEQPAEQGHEVDVEGEDSGSQRRRLRDRLRERRERSRHRRRRTTISAPEMTVDISFDRLRLTIDGVGTIMRGVSGSIPHGKLTAIMGPSGAGKTTFLTIMSGKVDRTGGTLKVNGEEEELSAFRNIIGFVPQEDIMMRDLTVEENVTHSALMRLPSSWSTASKLERVEEILEALEIDHIRDSVVGDEKKRGISGGQRKRVNIAMEMVTKPSLCCLDEPTSGLDSTTSYTVVNSMKEMARAGANVITVLHQPKYEVFELFDNVLLLGRGGMVVYYGPTSGMEDYFANRGFPCPPKLNPADYYMDVLSGIIPHESNDEWKKEDLFEEWMTAEENPDRMSKEEAAAIMAEVNSSADSEGKPVKNKFFLVRWAGGFAKEAVALWKHLFGQARGDRTGRKTPGVFSQFALLFKRAALQRLRTPGGTSLNIFLMFIAGAVLPNLISSDDILYKGIPISLTDDEDSIGEAAYLIQNVKPIDAIPGVMLNVYMFLLIVSCLSVNVFGMERTVFFRETAVGQSVVSYWAAKILEVLFWLPIYTSAFCLSGYAGEAWLLQSFRTYWCYMLLSMAGFYGLGMVASIIVGVASAALFALVFGLIILIFFSGTVNAYGDLSSGAQTFTSFWFIFWSTQGIVSEEYDQYADRFNVTRLNDETPNRYDNSFGIGEQAVGAGVGSGFDLESSNSRNFGFCALTVFAWYIIVLWALKTKDHRKHR